MTIATILSLMLAWTAPGKSLYSQTVVPAGSPAACSNQASLLCAEPRANPAWSGALTRPETREEGLVRYVQIARLIHEVADASTWTPASAPGCEPPRVLRWQNASEGCAAAHRARPWAGTADELVRYLLTVTAHESGWRLDVMSGRGERARGDCDGAKPATCKSICLGQIMRTRRGWTSQRGYSWESLAGTDDASVRRCLETVADYLGTARAVCTSPYGPVVTGPACIFRSYGGVRSAGDRRIGERAQTYARFGRRPVEPLPDDALAFVRP